VRRYERTDDGNGPLRDECMNELSFTTLPHARAFIEEWRQEYNERRPKKRLGRLSPAVYAALRRFNQG
jgi:putative transposase